MTQMTLAHAWQEARAIALERADCPADRREGRRLKQTAPPPTPSPQSKESTSVTGEEGVMAIVGGTTVSWARDEGGFGITRVAV